jgi:transcriptional regulator with XRE-family HTH domain
MDSVEERASQIALGFGSMIRHRRKSLGITQEELAAVTGVGRRFLLELEDGKATSQLGKSLLVAEILGVIAAQAEENPVAHLLAANAAFNRKIHIARRLLRRQSSHE